MDALELNRTVAEVPLLNPFMPNGTYLEVEARSRSWNASSSAHLIQLGAPRAVVDRQVLTNEQTYPWRTVGKIFVGQNLNFGSTIWVGSGVLVGPNLLLTASHVVPWDRGGWWMRFVPAFNTGVEPFGFSYVEQCRGIRNIDDVTGLDYVVCRLYTRLGDSVGWMGTYGSSGDSFYQNRGWTSVGYPVNTLGGQVPTVEDNIAIVDVDDESGGGKELESHVYSSGGWSGGPLWGFLSAGADPRVVGVVSGREEEFDFFSFFTATHTVNAGGLHMVNLVKYGIANWV
jgi:V8-like Glu-specific endopeptidase